MSSGAERRDFSYLSAIVVTAVRRTSSKIEAFQWVVRAGMRKPPRIAVFLAILVAVGIWVALDDGVESPAPRALPDGSRTVPPASPDIRAELPQRVPLQRAAKDPFSIQS